MLSWSALSGQEQVALVGAALSAGRKREINIHIWDDDTTTYPYARLQALNLITLVKRTRATVVYTISFQAVDLLLTAPDDADGQNIFPTRDDIQEMKLRLRRVRSLRIPAPSVLKESSVGI